MAGLDHLVVALGSPDADSALIRYAAVLASLGRTREVHFVHVAEPSQPSARLRDQMRAQVEAHFIGTPARIECDVLHGSLTDRLLAHVTELQADLIIIGSKKHKLGARLAMVAPCSVAVVPNQFPPTLSHLLVAFDFSEGAEHTLQWATALAAGDPSIRVTALHVITHESTDLFGDSETAEEQAERMRAILAGANRHGVSVTPRLVDVSRTTDVGRSHRFSLPASIQGIDVAQTILSEAEACGADCIAMSTRGRSRSASILLGSVTEKVIERATVPLLVGKRSAENLGLASILLGRAGWSEPVKTN
jgi:nucleotide-binding universal stress UspA family protein